MSDYPNVPDAEIIIQTVETCSASLSVIGCVLTLTSIYRKKKYHKLTNNLLVYLLVLDLILAIFYGIGISAQHVQAICDLQAMVVQSFGLCEIFWVTYMAYQMFCWVVRKIHPDRISKGIFLHFMIIKSITAILSFILLGLGVYEQAGIWCWIGEEYEDLRFFAFYILLIPAWVVTAVLFYSVAKSFQTKADKSVNVQRSELQSSERTIQLKLALYVMVFIFTWFFALLNRFLTYLNNKPVFVTAVLQASILPLRGFLNSIVYGNVFKITYDLFKENVIAVKHETHIPSSNYSFNEVDGAIGVPVFNTNNYKSKFYSIFTTTLNFGEASFDDVVKNMDDWIVKGHDIYVIGFQECLDILGLEQLIRQIIGEKEYMAFDNEIGSVNTSLGYHGYIGVMVFVRISDLLDGNVAPTNAAINNMSTGMNYIVGKAQNKGGVGLPFQIHDTSIAFVSCHLPSDSKGRSKLSKRNESAQSLLRELNLTPEDISFDVQFQHDHVVVLGDLNYRMDTEHFGGSVGLLHAVASACEIEKRTILDSSRHECNQANLSWLKRKFNLLREVNDPDHPTVDERRLLLAAKANSRSAWLAVLSADELRMIMEAGDAFYGFFEPLTCFPPSYKRRKNSKGDCGDYTALRKLLQGYSNIGRDSVVKPSDVTPNDTTTIRTSTGNGNIASSPSSSRVMSSATDISNTTSKTLSESESLKPTASIDQSLSNRADVGYGSMSEVSFRQTDLLSNLTSNLSAYTTTGVDGPVHDDRMSTIELPIRSFVPDDVQGDQTIITSTSIKIEDYDQNGANNQTTEISMNENAITEETKENTTTTGRTSLLSVEDLLKLSADLKEDVKKSRPPSYTDRILIHSLDDRREKLMIQAYDVCDSMRVSDHRPVCMTFRLEVNGDVKYLENAESKYRRNHEGITVSMYELTISNLTVHLGDTYIDESDKNTDEDIDQGEEDDDDIDVQDQLDGSSKLRPRSNTESVIIDMKPTPEKRSSVFAAPFRGSILTLSSNSSRKSQTSEALEKSSNASQSPTNALKNKRSIRSGKYLRVSLAKIRASREAEVTTAVSSLKGKISAKHGSTGIIVTSQPSPPSSSSPSPTPLSSSMMNSASHFRAILNGNTNGIKSYMTSASNDETRSSSPSTIPPPPLVNGFSRNSPGNSLHRTNSGSSKAKETTSDSLFQTPTELARSVTADSIWRQKVEEDERMRLIVKNEELSYRIKKTLGKKLHLHLIKEKKLDKRISDITIVFPLPSKDPLVTHRKVHDVAEALAVDSSELFSSYKASAERYMQSSTIDIHDPSTLSSARDPLIVSKDGFVRPFSTFPWIEQNQELTSETMQTIGQKTVNLKISGILSPELGAHVLLKMKNKAGFDLGECVVCLSHLVNSNPRKIMKTEVKKIPISSGGQIMGDATATFSLRYLPNPEEGTDYAMDKQFDTSISASISSSSSLNPMLSNV